MSRHEQWSSFLRNCTQVINPANSFLLSGTVTKVTGLVMEAVGLRLAVGSSCTVFLANGQNVSAEVVGFSGERLFLMPSSDVYGLSPGARVFPSEVLNEPPRIGNFQPPRRRAADRAKHVIVGPELLGRVLNGVGEPLDRLGPTHAEHSVPLYSRPFNPLERTPVSEPLDVGVRAINTLLTVGRGQRMGLFAGSGVGKSVLLGMMARYTTADVIVVGLIGERGREVKEFIENILGKDGLARSVVVAAPADTSPLLRLQGAAYATAIAEYFRDSGKHVLLIMDSLTRYAMAQREISLAIGEPPATKGYPPSVFAKLPQLVERAGNGNQAGGSITAFYTVLAEGDDQNDPIVDSARAILDGHIVLSRRLAEAGHYPAIDIEASISRVMTSVVPQKQIDMARQFKSLYARYQRSHDLISVGAYVAGTDPELDRAIRLYPSFEKFLHQTMSQYENFADSLVKLTKLFEIER
ncbi:flagellar protein export ATPase FliI [Nitrosomonas ureae]|uniref:Flagellum-specific ATP synthase n=1 Tax=Nitrosomonas ureae TaxID=44577 RepID=A0A0S3AGS0_9PROT|nr:flagellar protein export ATPase FliI [Nitrosomonas ureae]ALQ50364.1 flagellar protein export ATPase FliI [Nitrosomonas ureae]PTQ87446.1 flagellum-specific ATP synthase [Nitrosomonas ureae]SDT87786.1 flagellum-specific ATP synthase [Nitrosomonas ureae]SOD17439.1 flagellum-specific ATP synthase [Nitrosomonas ureae]